MAVGYWLLAFGFRRIIEWRLAIGFWPLAFVGLLKGGWLIALGYWLRRTNKADNSQQLKNIILGANLSFQYPIWFLFFCVLLGLGYALVLYYKDKTFKGQSKKTIWLLAVVRFLAVTLISALLLSPLLKSMTTETQKPIVILAQDNSESIMAAMNKEDSASYRANMQGLADKLSEEYDLKQYAFGSEVRQGIDYSFTDKVTNMSSLLNEMYDLYSNQNLGAVIIASDGIYNQGSNPVYAGAKLNVPMYTVALGDTTLKRDISIKRIYHNRIAYLGDKFSIQIDVAARNCANESTSVNIYKVNSGGQTRLASEPVSIKGKDFFTTKEVILDADQAGVQRYRVIVSQVKNEVSTVNNVKDIFIDVLDARQKILLLAYSPHPDLSALKQTIAKNKNYEVDIAYIDRMQVNLRSYDFVVLHQLPSGNNSANSIIKELNANKTPRLYILGGQSGLPALGQAQSFLKVKADVRNANDVTATVDPSFNLFNLDERVGPALPKFAPLTSPFGEYTATPDAQVLLYQKIGSVATKYPLLVFGEENDTKMAILAAEGIWKWRVFDYLQHKNHDIFDEIFGKTIQYLSVKEDKRKFRVAVNKNIFNENESILFDAELYNESYQLINDPDASLVITNGEGKDFNYTFTKTSQAYTLNAGLFPVGNYSYRARTTSAGKELVYSGKFSVQPIQLESFETTADHNVLRLLSQQLGGHTIYPSQLLSISDSLAAKSSVKPVLYATSKTRSVINLKWIFFLLLGLLTVEWFFRKFYGGY